MEGYAVANSSKASRQHRHGAAMIADVVMNVTHRILLQLLGHEYGFDKIEQLVSNPTNAWPRQREGMIESGKKSAWRAPYCSGHRA